MIYRLAMGPLPGGRGSEWICPTTFRAATVRERSRPLELHLRNFLRASIRLEVSVIPLEPKQRRRDILREHLEVRVVLLQNLIVLPPLGRNSVFTTREF